MADQWSYYVHAVKNPGVSSLQDALTRLGHDGWELVTSLTTVKTWVNLTGNDLVFIFRKAGGGHRPPALGDYDDDYLKAPY